MRFWSRNRSAERSALTIRPGSTIKRDVFKAATAGATGVTAFGALAVTGAVAGTAAHDQAAKEKVAPPAPPAAQVVTKRRKHRTVVRTRIVHAVSTSGVTSTGSGGYVRPSSSTHSSGGGSTATHSAPRPAAPKPAAPKPKPAPSSGS